MVNTFYVMEKKKPVGIQIKFVIYIYDVIYEWFLNDMFYQI